MRSFLRRYDRFVDICGELPGWLVALIALVIFVDVVSRNVGFGAIGGTLEIVQYALVVLTFVGAVWLFRAQRHIQVEILVAILPAPARRIAAFAARLVVLAVSLVTTWALAKAALLAWSDGSVIRRVLTVPEWIPIAVVLLGFVLLSVEALRQLLAPPEGPDGPTGAHGAPQDPDRAR